MYSWLEFMKYTGNHTAYRQFKGTKASAQEIKDIYEGLKQNGLRDFNVLLSGYAPGADAVNAIGYIGHDLKMKARGDDGSFFWGLYFLLRAHDPSLMGFQVMDPVMGDQGRLYVSEDVVPAYKGLLKDADLILPNQFEAEYVAPSFGPRIRD